MTQLYQTFPAGAGLAAFFASAERVNAALVANPFGAKVEALLAKLPVDLKKQIKPVLRQTSRGEGCRTRWAGRRRRGRCYWGQSLPSFVLA